MGYSSKRDISHMIGTHGEGMKIGIMRLICDGHSVTYLTGNKRWKFFQKRPPGSNLPTLCFHTSTVQRKSTDTIVQITNVTEHVFKVRDFLPLSPDVLVQVKESVCSAGYLLRRPSRPIRTVVKKENGRGDGRVFVRGIFAFEDDVHFPINVQMGELTRDRDLITGRLENFLRVLAEIWVTLLKKESSFAAGKRRFSNRLLLHVIHDSTSLEYQCLRYLDQDSAHRLFDLIQWKNANAYPYRRGNDREASAISRILQKTPYPCSLNLYMLMLRSGCFRQVDELNRSQLVACPSASVILSEYPLARMVAAYVRYVQGDSVQVRFKGGLTVRAFRSENKIYVAQELIVSPPERKHAVNVLNTVEWAVVEGQDLVQRERIIVLGKEFLGGEEFRAFLKDPVEEAARAAVAACLDENKGNRMQFVSSAGVDLQPRLFLLVPEMGREPGSLEEPKAGAAHGSSQCEEITQADRTRMLDIEDPTLDLVGLDQHMSPAGALCKKLSNLSGATGCGNKLLNQTPTSIRIAVVDPSFHLGSPLLSGRAGISESIARAEEIKARKMELISFKLGKYTVDFVHRSPTSHESYQIDLSAPTRGTAPINLARQTFLSVEHGLRIMQKRYDEKVFELRIMQNVDEGNVKTSGNDQGTGNTRAIGNGDMKESALAMDFIPANPAKRRRTESSAPEVRNRGEDELDSRFEWISLDVGGRTIDFYHRCPSRTESFEVLKTREGDRVEEVDIVRRTNLNARMGLSVVHKQRKETIVELEVAQGTNG